MRISIREALFGGEEVDDWTPPPEWEKVTDNREWTPEFASEQGISQEISCNFKGYKQMNVVDQSGLEIYTHGTTPIGPQTWDCFVNKDTKHILMVPVKFNWPEKGIRIMQEYIDSNPIPMGSKVKMKEVVGGKS